MASGETAALKVESLTKDYGNFKLDKVCFELPKGYVMGFVGRNGAGKSTTLSCIMRSVIPDGGKVTVDGEDISENEIEVLWNIRELPSRERRRACESVFDVLSVFRLR